MTTNPTLLLTPTMQPHRVVAWSTSIVMLLLDKIEVVHFYEGEDAVVRTPSRTFVIPSVARIRSHVGNTKRGVKFSKLNVCLRDGFTCQYCGVKLPMKKLNYDHVVPRRLGGKTTWENIVASCYPCNDRKAGRTPEQAGMKLRKYPAKPKSLPLNGPVILGVTEMPVEWTYYLKSEEVALTA